MALPPRNLICTRNGKHYKWYQSNGHTYTYISKDNPALANQLAYKNTSVLSRYFTPRSHDLSEWMSSTYEHNINHPEHLIHRSNSGHFLRSKSEAIIDMLLYMHQIPFRYECVLRLGDYTLYPDFLIG